MLWEWEVCKPPCNTMRLTPKAQTTTKPLPPTTERRDGVLIVVVMRLFQARGIRKWPPQEVAVSEGQVDVQINLLIPSLLLLFLSASSFPTGDMAIGGGASREEDEESFKVHQGLLSHVGGTTTTLLISRPHHGGYHTFMNGNNGSHDIEDKPLPVPSSQSNLQLCELPCFLQFTKVYCLFLSLVTTTILMAYVIKPPGLGILLLGLLPSTCLLIYLQSIYHKSVLRRQMIMTFFEAINYMSLICKFGGDELLR